MESYYISSDRLGNRSVVLCENGYPIMGVLLTNDDKRTLKDDIKTLVDANPPIGGMLLDTPMCIYIVEQGNGIMVSDNEIECSRELSDEEKSYISSR